MQKNCENVTNLNNYHCKSVNKAFMKKKPKMAKSYNFPKISGLQFGNFPYVGSWLVMSFRPF